MARTAKRGDPIKEHITATWINQLNKKRNKDNKHKIPPPENPVQIPCTTTSSTIARFTAVKLEETSTQWNDETSVNTLYCKITDLPEPNNWGIVQGPCNNETPSKVTVLGLTWANFTYTTGDTHVDIVNNALVSTKVGPAIIIEPPNSASEPGLIFIQGPALDDTFLFTLTQDMTTDASATIKTMDDVTTIGTFDVINTLNHFSHLLTGDRGICVKSNGAYYAIHPESAAPTKGHIFELTQDLAGSVGSTAQAEVLISGEDTVSIGATITVYNTGGKVGKIGATGWCIKIGTEYWLVEINQYPILMEITLISDTHSLSAGGTRQGKVADQIAYTFTAETISEYPFDFVPGVITLYNVHNFLGLANDRGLITWNSTDSQFQLIAILPVKKRKIQFVLTADVDEITTYTTDFNVRQTREQISGEVEATTQLYDPMKLVRGNQSGDYGEATYSFIDEVWQITAIRRRVYGALLLGELTALEEDVTSSSEFFGLMIGTIDVFWASCGLEYLIGTSVEVVDWWCIFDKTFEELDGVQVSAAEGVGFSQATGAYPGTLTDCHWSALDRCCVEADFY